MIGTLGDLVEDVAVWLAGPVNVASDTRAHIRRRRGGSAANTAVALARLGVPARFIGQVGDDPIGTALLATMSADGVDLAVHRAGRTGTIVVLVDAAGERTMLTDRGACIDLADPEPAWLDGLSTIHVPAYSLVEGAIAPTAATVIAWAHERNVTVSIDASSVSIISDFGVDPMRQLLARSRAEVLLCNEMEAAALGGAATLHDLATRVVVVKQGAEPALVMVRGEGVVDVPVPPVEAVSDTTGAGDAFAAGFLAALATGSTPVEAAVAGHRSARDAIIAVSHVS